MWKSKYNCSIVDGSYLCTKAETAGAGEGVGDCWYDPKAKYPELRIRASHVTRDMSVGGSYDNDYFVEVGDGQTNSVELDSLDGGRVEMVSATKEAVTLRWHGQDFLVKMGTEARSEAILVNNPMLSSDVLTLIFNYRETPDYAELWNMIADLGMEEIEGKGEKHEQTARKREILHFIDKAIGKGNTGLYVAKALLTIYNDWGTCKIGYLDGFRNGLLEGIGKGCLAPDNLYGWEWMEVATKYNDPADFLEDMELFYDVLATAAGEGCVEALDIMNDIWEPEQIIEED